MLKDFKNELRYRVFFDNAQEISHFKLWSYIHNCELDFLVTVILIFIIPFSYSSYLSLVTFCLLFSLFSISSTFRFYFFISVPITTSLNFPSCFSTSLPVPHVLSRPWPRPLSPNLIFPSTFTPPPPLSLTLPSSSSLPRFSSTLSFYPLQRSLSPPGFLSSSCLPSSTCYVMKWCTSPTPERFLFPRQHHQSVLSMYARISPTDLLFLTNHT